MDLPTPKSPTKTTLNSATICGREEALSIYLNIIKSYKISFYFAIFKDESECHQSSESESESDYLLVGGGGSGWSFSTLMIAFVAELATISKNYRHSTTLIGLSTK